MIAKRPQIDRRGRRRDCCVLDCLLMGGPFPALPTAVAITALLLTPTNTAPSTSPIDGRVSLTDERG